MVFTYTAGQFLRLLSTVEEFEIAAIHDFCYRIDARVGRQPRTEDAVFVLRRRAS